ncbi:MAG: hypothetical protein ACOY3M_01825 [Patescibacteria group bacterium]
MKLISLLKGILPLFLLFGGCPLVSVETSGEFYVECPIGETMSIYVVESDKFPDGFTCNTTEMQNATATFTDGTTISMFIEYNGQFVSWSVPPEYTCAADFGQGDVSVQPTGNQSLETNPNSVHITCTSGTTTIIMEGILIPSLPQQEA